MALTKEELEQIQKMMTTAAGIVETKLGTSLNKAIEGIDAKVEASTKAATDLVANAKAAVSAMPNLIQEHVEAQLRTNLTGIVEEVGKQFEAKMKEKLAGGGNSEGGSMSLRELLEQSPKVIEIINAWKQPTTEQAMLSQLNFGMKIHSLMSKLEKGGGSGDEFAKTIASTFTETQE